MNHLINFQYAQKLFIFIKPKYFPEARMAPIFTIYHHHFITTISGDTQLQALRWKLLKNKDLFHISVAPTQDPASIVPPTLALWAPHSVEHPTHRCAGRGPDHSWGRLAAHA